MCRHTGLVGLQTIGEYGYLSTTVGTLHQELLELLLTRFQSKGTYRMSVQSRTTAFENGE